MVHVFPFGEKDVKLSPPLQIFFLLSLFSIFSACGSRRRPEPRAGAAHRTTPHTGPHRSPAPRPCRQSSFHVFITGP